MTNIQEIWKDIPDHTEYQASNTGFVRSKDRIIKILRRGKIVLYPHRGKILSSGISRFGYHSVNIGYGNQLVHRIIAKTFLQNPLNKPCVNHIDSNKSNNAVSNLEWVTHKENTAHAISNGKLILNGEDNPFAKLSYNQVCSVRQQIISGLNCGEIGRNFNVSPDCIRKIKKGKNWKNSWPPNGQNI